MMHKEGSTFLKLDGLLVRCISQPTVTVRNTGDGTLASIYATNSQVGGQLKSNPFTGNADGSWDFYIPDTRYNTELSGGTPVLGATLVSSDQIAFDPFIHFSFSNLNSGYLLQQNSAGVFTPVAPGSLGYDGRYVQLTGVSCGNPSIRSNPTSGFPVLETVMTGTGWLQAWKTSSGFDGAQTTRAYLDNLGVMFAQGFQPPLGSAAAPAITNSFNASAGVYWPHSAAVGLTGSGGLMTLIVDGRSGTIITGPLAVSSTVWGQRVYLLAGTAVAPTLANSDGVQRAGVYFPHSNAVGLTGSGGIITLNVDPNSGAVLAGKTYVGNACGLTTSSAIITASKAIGVADLGVTQVCSTATNITLTLSTNAGFAAPLGSVLPIFRAGAGTVTVTSGGAVTILGGQFTVNSLAGASLEKIATDTWLMRA